MTRALGRKGTSCQGAGDPERVRLPAQSISRRKCVDKEIQVKRARGKVRKRVPMAWE
jgi:hypothetical protein